MIAIATVAGAAVAVAVPGLISATATAAALMVAIVRRTTLFEALILLFDVGDEIFTELLGAFDLVRVRPTGSGQSLRE